MTKAIHKFPLSSQDRFKLALPIGAQIIAVQTQRDIPMIWAIVTPNADTEPRTFEMVGTGHPLPQLATGERRKYLATFQLYGGSLVFHFFEIVQV